jgi:hypothetical protein
MERRRKGKEGDGRKEKRGRETAAGENLREGGKGNGRYGKDKREELEG